MSKRLRNLLLLGAAILTTVSTVSFGYFFFGDIKEEPSKAVSNLKVDDIYENYKSIGTEGGNIDLEDQRYDLYIYPSAEYIEIYNNFLTAVEERLNANFASTIPSKQDIIDTKKLQTSESMKSIYKTVDGKQVGPYYDPLTYKPSPEAFNGSLKVSYKDDSDIVRDPKRPDEPLLRTEVDNIINPSYVHKDFRNQTAFNDFVSKTYTKHLLGQHVPDMNDLKQGSEYHFYPADMYVQYLNDNYMTMYTVGDLYHLKNHFSITSPFHFISTPSRWEWEPFPFYASMRNESLIVKSLEPYVYYANHHFIDSNNGDHFYKFNEWYQNMYWDEDILEHNPGHKDEWRQYRISSTAGYQRNIYRIYNYHATKYEPGVYRTYGKPTDKSFLDTYGYSKDGKPGIVENYINLYKDVSKSKHIEDGYDYNYTDVTKYKWDDGHQDGNNALFADDRFGCWKYLTMEEGRFSPIHISIDNSITPQVFSKAFGTLYSSMNDGNKSPWFQNNFSNFVYAKTNGVDTSTPSKYKFKKSFPIKSLDQHVLDAGQIHPRDLMSGYDIDNIFDITKPLSEYADEDNVIRLFPIFSGGKGYYSQEYKRVHKSDPDVDNVARILGGKDQITFNIDHNISFPNGTSFTKHFIKNPAYLPKVAGAPLYQDKYDISCGYLSSVPINIYTLKTKLQVTFHIADGPGNWGGLKPVPYTLDFNLPETMKYIKGSGYYNIYIFVGNSGYPCTQFDPNTYNPGDEVPRIDSYFDTSLNQPTNFLDAFPNFKDKRLIKVPCEKGVVDYYDPATKKPVTFQQSPTDPTYIRGNHINQRPVFMMLEKAVEPKFYTNVNMTDITQTELDALATKKHDIAPTGYRFDRPTFAMDEPGVVKQVYAGESIDGQLTNKNLYYVFKNVDFTDTLHNDFVLRFGDDYDNTIKIADVAQHNNIYIKKQAYPPETLPSIPTKEQLEDKNSEYLRLWPAFGANGVGNFFSLKTKEMDINGTKENVQYMSLNDNQQRGVYDVILVQRDGTSKAPNADSVVEFDIYTYRHTNIFIKLFRTDPKGKYTDLTDTNNPIEFIDHKSPTDLLFEKKCFIGDILDNGERSDIHNPGKKGKNIDEIIRNNIQRWHNQENATYDPTDPNAVPPIDFSNVVIRDHVTGAPVIWYNPIAGNKALLRGEVNPLDGKQFKIYYDPNFVILKNHVLYISTKGKL